VKAHFSRLPGGHYRAQQHDDGTWDVFDVPVFSVVPKGVKGAPKDIGEDDLRAAVALHERLFSDDKFLPRLNTLHNFGLHKATPGGFFLPKTVRPFRMKGRSVPVIFADLIAVPDEIFRAMEQDKLPYCSVEIRAWQPLQFGALALLDTEPPFFEFPLITIGDAMEVVTTGVQQTRFSHTEQAPAVAAFVARDGAGFLFRFGDEDMPDDEKKKDENIEAEMADEGGGSDLAAAVKAIEEQMKALEPLLALKDKIAAMVESSGTVDEVETEEEVKAEGPVEMSADRATQMSARVSALEDYREQAEREKRRDAIFNEAITGLEGDGYHLSEGSRKRLFEAAERGKDTLELFMASYRETAPKDPPSDLEGLEPGEEAWPTEVMQFAHQGPHEFSEAKRVYREWLELENHKAFSGHIGPLDKFLARNVRKEA